jgi:hypothetical protein
MRSISSSWNLESLIKFHLIETGLWESVRFFPYVMYTVRSLDGPTRWSQGTYSSEHGYFIKYPSEYNTASYYKYTFESSGESLSQFYLKQVTDVAR